MKERNIQTNNPKPKKTSWEGVSKWYNDLVGEKGHYYHEKIILPSILNLLDLSNSPKCSLLDLACGQGILARHIPEKVLYTGVDISSSLIKSAKTLGKKPQQEFLVADASKPLPLNEKTYTHAAIILALQNIENGEGVIHNCALHLESGGKVAIVLNHPCFRIPRQSSWQIDEAKKTQYRRVDRYRSEMKIPIQAHPGKKELSSETWSFHNPLSTYSLWLYRAGFKILLIEEWCSDKVSSGKNSKMENRSREEIPMFLTILATKE